MAIVIDGIALPEFPEGLFDDEYKYGIIFMSHIDETYTFVSMSSPVEFVHIPGALIGMSGDYATSMATIRVSAYLESSNSWRTVSTDDPPTIPLGDGFSLGWSNHDIKTVIAINEDTFELTTGDEIYFRNSETPAEPEPEYGKIRRAIIRGASNAVRRKTGRTDKFPPEQLEYEIDSIVTADGLPVAEEYSFGTPASEYGLVTSSDWVESQYGDNYTQGWTFTANETIDVIGLRHGYSNANSVSKTLALWDNSGNLLKSLSVKGNVNLGEWVDFYFDEPITLQAGQNYTVSCRSMYKVRTSNFSVNPKITYLGYGETASSTSKPSYSTKTQCVAVDIILDNKIDVAKPNVYQISLSTLDSLSFVTQRIVGNPNVMTPAQMISALEGVATATAEE